MTADSYSQLVHAQQIYPALNDATCQILGSYSTNTSAYSSRSCNAIKIFSNEVGLVNLQGIDILYDPVGIPICNRENFDSQCDKFLNSSYFDQYVKSDFTTLNQALYQRYNNTGFVWNVKIMSKPWILSFSNFSSVIAFKELLEAYNYCNFCSHSRFEAFHTLKNNNPASLEFKTLELAYSNKHCANGIPVIDVPEYSATGDGYDVSVTIQCNCRNGVLSNVCDFYSDVIYPLFSGKEILITSIVTYSLLFLASVFLNFIPILAGDVRKFIRSDKSLKTFFFSFTDLRLQASFLFTLSMILAIISSCLGVAGNPYAVLTMTLAACLEFIAYIPILFCWIDVIYRTEMNMTKASWMINSLAIIFSLTFVFALALYMIGYLILSVSFNYAVYIVVQIFLVVVIIAAVVIVFILIVTAGRLLLILSKTKKINILSYRFTRFLIYVTIFTCPYLIQAAYYIMTSVEPRMVCRFYALFSYFLSSLCVSLISFGFLYILYNTDDLLKAYPCLDKIVNKIDIKKIACSTCVAKADPQVPRLSLSFIAPNVSVSYADYNLMFRNATYYYDYYSRAERIDLLDIDKTYLTNRTIINFYGPRVPDGKKQVPVTTYIIEYQQMTINNKLLTFYNCTKTNRYWQFGYGMSDMPFWSIKLNDPTYKVSFVKYQLEGALRYELWQDQYNGESLIYHISTESRSLEFAQLLFARDYMVALDVAGTQLTTGLHREYFNIKNFGCE
ncbi:hypothetical protein C9374_002780 [Naegleria lovaniensis]|uniref:Uncharacterized protein n=1 Tax=Naegleria lovaniensis TaxID=51637 RepID=A0AA88KLY7_NAELO|nr:uncharacterized protein C9374_002780 [Naegleria lovaniensis]KAG2386334.1 hypothetical protein C9374_002780 [Naegleria lovaniensis]